MQVFGSLAVDLPTHFPLHTGVFELSFSAETTLHIFLRFPLQFKIGSVFGGMGSECVCVF